MRLLRPTNLKSALHQSSIGDDSAAPAAKPACATLIPSPRHIIVIQTPLFAGV